VDFNKADKELLESAEFENSDISSEVQEESLESQRREKVPLKLQIPCPVIQTNIFLDVYQNIVFWWAPLANWTAQVQ
jgi:hypothetical protein